MSRKKKIKNTRKIRKMGIIAPILCLIALSVITFGVATSAYNAFALFLELPIIAIGMFISALTGKAINTYAKDHGVRKASVCLMMVYPILLGVICKIIIESNAPYSFCFDSCNDINTSSAVGSGLFMVIVLLLPAWFSVITGPVEETPKSKPSRKKKEAYDDDDSEEL